MATQNHYMVVKTAAPWVVKLTQVGGAAPTPGAGETLYTFAFTSTEKGPGTPGFVGNTQPTWTEWVGSTLRVAL